MEKTIDKSNSQELITNLFDQNDIPKQGELLYAALKANTPEQLKKQLEKRTDAQLLALLAQTKMEVDTLLIALKEIKEDRKISEPRFVDKTLDELKQIDSLLMQSAAIVGNIIDKRRENNRRMAIRKKTLQRLEIQKNPVPVAVNPNIVNIGDMVTVVIDGEETKVTLVERETDHNPIMGDYWVGSSFGQALRGKKVGEEFTWIQRGLSFKGIVKNINPVVKTEDPQYTLKRTS